MKPANNQLRTKVVTPQEKVARAWHLVDAKEKSLGRMSTEVADLLRGRRKSDWSPMQDIGDHVVIINTQQLKISPKKIAEKKYYRHSTYPGHLKVQSLKSLIAERPTEAVRRAIYGMLPKNKLRKQMLRRLHIFANDQHTFVDRIKPDEIKKAQ